MQEEPWQDTHLNHNFYFKECVTYDTDHGSLSFNIPLLSDTHLNNNLYYKECVTYDTDHGSFFYNIPLLSLGFLSSLSIPNRVYELLSIQDDSLVYI